MAEKSNEAEILFSEQQLEIKGEKLTVREFSFIEGLRINQMVRPFIKSMRHVFTEEDKDSDFSSMSAAFSDHMDVLIELMSISTGKPVEWFSTLTDTEGQTLLMAFWSVNKAFFINRLLIQGMGNQQASASDTSTAD